MAVLAVGVGTLAVAGCAPIGYLSQAAAGQFSIWWRQQPIEALLRDPQTDPELAQRLGLALSIRQFASDELGLPENDSYRYFVDIHRPYVVWNVFAAEEFSVEPRTWCFPISGCVSYRGYFSQQAAETFRQQLAGEGLDTYLAGVPAYSTLGWFDDPLLSSVIDYDEGHLAGLIFHELAHQQLYLAGDTTFNESFATALEIEGIRRWFEAQGDPAALEAYMQVLNQRRDLVATLLDLRERLRKLYAQNGAGEQLRRQKQELLEQFVQQDLRQFARRWREDDRFEEWAAMELNNARLVTVSSYYQWLDAFLQLMKQCGGDTAEFFRRAEILAKLETKEREHQLLLLAAEFEKLPGSVSL